MRVQICLLLLGFALVSAQVPATKTRKGRPPVRQVHPAAGGRPPRRNDVKDVPDNAGYAPPPPTPVIRGPPPPRAPVHGPPPPRVRPAHVPRPRVPASPPAVRPLPPRTRTKSVGFLGGGIPYVPPAGPVYAPTTLPPIPTTQYYPSYDTPDVKKEEEEESSS